MVLCPSRNQPLAPLTTFELGGTASWFVEARTRAELIEAVRWAETEGHRLALVAGGSNTLAADEGFAGLVVRCATRGVVEDPKGDAVDVTAQAGEPWGPFVERVVDAGLAGLECLAGIPGTVGATPIQNVGAYGQDVAGAIVRVEVLDRATDRLEVLGAADCGFAYRSSRLKHARLADGSPRHVVLEVTFRLRRGAPPTITYAELRSAVAEAATLREVSDAVVRLRRRKSMVLDPSDPNRRSAGSFFTNALVPRQVAEEVRRRARERGLGEVPSWPEPDGRVKLAAAWLIEQAGFVKGTRRGAVGLSSVHALALVHHGGGSTRELLAFAAEIERSVFDAFGVRLEREPVLLG